MEQYIDANGIAEDNSNFESTEPLNNGPAGDTLDDLFGGEQIQTNFPESVEAKSNPSRHEYWQSQADKLKLELDVERKKSTRVERYAPILEFLEEDPARLVEVEKLRQGNAQQQQQAKVIPQLEKPVKPMKPANFNTLEASSNAESESGKYMVSLMDYQEQLTDYLERKDALGEQRMQVARERVTQRQQEDNILNSAYQMATQQYKMDSQKANRFLAWSSNPENITMDNLVALFDKLEQSQPQQQTMPQGQDVISRQNRSRVAMPVGVGQGMAPQQGQTDEMNFNAGLIPRKIMLRK